MVIRSQAELRRMLEEERTRLRRTLRHREPWMDEQGGCNNHLADVATEAFEQAKALCVCIRLNRTLVDIEDALRKFDLGTFGVCESCGTQIDWARLEAKPEARHCIKCRRKRDFVHLKRRA